jgi:uncharacterized membrane protein
MFPGFSFWLDPGAGGCETQLRSRKEPSMTETAQTGLSDNGAGALAYVTFIPAIVFLAMPPYNRNSYVRFHSWQSIFLAAAWVAILIVLTILIKIPFFGLIIFPIMLLVDLGMFILWLVVVLKALNGQRFKIPVIGALAETQAGK